MKILAFGKDPNGKPLFKATDEDDVSHALLAALKRQMPGLRTHEETTSPGVMLRGEMKRRVVDVGDPRQVGWSFLVSSSDPQRADIESILQPLANHRGMIDPIEPLRFSGDSEEKWGDWLQDRYYGLELEGKQVPQYILMAGDPAYLPFKLQSLFGTVANVGRVAFDQLSELDSYVHKLLRLETAPEPIVERRVFLFGPDEGLESDPTFYSRKYMIEPLCNHIRNDLHFEVASLVGDAATKEGLVRMLRSANPALVYTASHGLAVNSKRPEQQARYNGAICCYTTGPAIMDALFSADDVPAQESFLEGAVFFQFACFGYGTPAQSDYVHWLRGMPRSYAAADFMAALPRQLIAHPRGPIAYVGHLDTAFLHGFADPREPTPKDRWNERIQPFVHAVDQLLGVQPSGLAMEDMGKRLRVANQLLMIYYDRQRRGALDLSPDASRRLVDNWIFRSDAQNYMIFGDPAARLRVPDVQRNGPKV